MTYSLTIMGCHQDKISHSESDFAPPQVLVFNSSKSFSGLNIAYDSMFDMNGKIIKIFKGAFPVLWGKDYYVAFSPENGLTKYAFADDRIIWSKKDIIVHHHMELSEKNTLIVLAKEKITLRGETDWMGVILEFDEEGKQIGRWAIKDHLDELNAFHPHSQRIKNYLEEYMLNYVHVIMDNKLGFFDSRFKKGNLLLSFYDVPMLVILDRQTKDIVWTYTSDILIKTHTPNMLENGHILIFDNGHILKRRLTRILELDPLNGNVLWMYPRASEEGFFTSKLGSAYRLPNGNTLIATGETGLSFEITPSGEKVWEWMNTRVKGEPLASYRMIRIPMFMY